MKGYKNAINTTWVLLLQWMVAGTLKTDKGLKDKLKRSKPLVTC